MPFLPDVFDSIWAGCCCSNKTDDVEIAHAENTIPTRGQMPTYKAAPLQPPNPALPLPNLLGWKGAPQQSSVARCSDFADKNVSDDCSTRGSRALSSVSSNLSTCSSMDGVRIGRKCLDWTDKFPVSLYKQNGGQELGLELTVLDDNSCFVMEVTNGLVQEWNDRVHTDRQIRVGDRILEVNEDSGCAASILRRLKEDAILHVLVKRREEVSVSVTPGIPGSSLGRDVLCHNGEGLRIQNIKSNAFRDWNAQHPDCPHWQVAVNDVIVEVNGLSGSPQGMLKELTRAEKLNLQVVCMR